jgi:hypothetical protein
MMIAASEFKKSYRVYAIVGAACANTEFRRKLFAAFDERSVDGLRIEVNRCLRLSGDPRPEITEDELALIWRFVAPRAVAPAGVPPVEAERAAGAPSIKTFEYVPPSLTFEDACNAFSRSVCPWWPCDDYSA